VEMDHNLRALFIQLNYYCTMYIVQLHDASFSHLIRNL